MPEQWVNITRDEKWVGGPVTSIERAGPIMLKVTLEHGVGSKFKYRFVPDGGNATYTLDERNRSTAFRSRNAKGSAIIANTQTVEYEVFLPAAGGNKYKLEYEYKGKVTQGPEYEARRLVYFQSISMEGIEAPDLGAVKDAFWAPDKGYCIKLEEKPAGEEVAFQKAVQDRQAFLSVVEESFTLEALRPKSFGIVWVEYIAQKAGKDIKQGAEDVSAQSALWSWDDAARALTVDVGSYLWHGLDDNDDAAQAWLNGQPGVSLTFEDNTREMLKVPREKVTLDGAPAFEHGGYTRIKMDLRDPQRDKKKVNKIAFILKTFIAAVWSGGFSRGKFIVVATKGLFASRSEAEIRATIIHEIGHKIGMVPEPAGPNGGPDPTRPDGPDTYYEGQDHNGPHCQNGAAYTPPANEASIGTWSGAPACVMFGAASIQTQDGAVAKPQEFCAKCAPVVRKLALRTLW
ncbi:MAG: hypothetical protein IT372_30825 [Polyangiaceae bacterium]|nr:hypothetical protein [Polyangiaceae bacterium]